MGNHLIQLKTVFTRLRDAGLKIHAKKSFFGQTELEYLGYCYQRWSPTSTQKGSGYIEY